MKLFVLAGEKVVTSDRSERATRILIGALFLAPPLFVLIQLSPTAWAIALPIILVLNDPRPLLAPSLRLCAASPFIPTFLLLAALSAAWSVDPLRSLSSAYKSAGFFVLGALTLAQLDLLPERSLSRIRIALMTGCMIGILCLASIEVYAWCKLARTTELDRTLHKIAFYGLYFAAFLLGAGRFFWLRIGFVGVAFALPTLFLGHTAGVNLAIGLLFIIGFLGDCKQKAMTVALVGAYCFAAVGLPFVVEWAYAHVDQFSIPVLPSTRSYMARLELWQVLSPKIKEALLLGHGADTTRIASIPFGTFKYYDNPDLPSAHNVVVDTWYELGLAGIFVLLAVIVGLTRKALSVSAGTFLPVFFVLIGTLIELAVDHRIWLSWLQGILIFAFVGGKVTAEVMKPAPSQDQFI